MLPNPTTSINPCSKGGKGPKVLGWVVTCRVAVSVTIPNLTLKLNDIFTSTHERESCLIVLAAHL